MAHQGKMELETNKGEHASNLIQLEKEAKKELMELEYYFQTGIKAEEAKAQKSKETYKEDRKDDRQAESATQQSQIKAESAKEKPQAQQFTSANTSISGEVGIDEFRT
jgi:hypothetical protein